MENNDFRIHGLSMPYLGEKSKIRRLTTKRPILYNSNNLIISDKCGDEEEYIGSPKQREKMEGANLREGLMEVASER